MPPTRAPIRKHLFRRRRIVVFGAIVVVLAILFYLPVTLLAPLKAVQLAAVGYSAQTTTAPALSLPGYGASGIAAVGYPGLLASAGSSKPLPIASITKIVSALVVLQKKPLSPGEPGPPITFTSFDETLLKSYAARDGDVYPIRVGGSMSELDVMTIALVPSANNYIRALVDWAYGSEANFLPVAKAWLKANGMTSTTLTDATGLNPANRSTPTDLIALGKLALANPIVSQLINIRKITLPVVGTISNTNKLLGETGIDGVKTGTLNSAGSSLLFASNFTIGGRRITLVGVVLDGPSHPAIDAQIHNLVEQVMTGFKVVKLTSAGQRFAVYSTVWGTTSYAIASRGQSVVVWGGTRIVEKLSAGGVILAPKGSTVGSATFTVGTQTVSVPLRLSTSITDPGVLWRLTHPQELL